ncbi:MAG: hypothetical protein DIU60_007005 [Actinomycetes bacterium]|nr:MAG: hypothetical protein DIU60_07335 [Actinomycetota bacterium]
MDGTVPILAELATLTRDKASGALRIDGDPGGVVYLDAGRLVFAEAVGVPDVGTRLIGTRLLSAGQWAAACTPDPPPDGVGALLVRSGLLGRDDLLAVLRSASLDALTALATPLMRPPSVTRLWFAERERPWIGSLLSLEVDWVRAELARRADLLAATPVPLDARPVGTDLRRPFGRVGRAEWAMACRIDGATSLRELAWRYGLALYDTVESVGGLLREGLCALLAPDDADARPAAASRPGGTTSEPSGNAASALAAPAALAAPPATDAPPYPATAPAGHEEDAGDAGAAAEAAPPPLPRRNPGTPRGARPRAEGPMPPGAEQAAGTPFALATPELLRRLLDGLRRLDEDD